METMQLTPPATPTDLTQSADAAIEDFFAEAGLDVAVVAHCDDAACSVCFAQRPARAA